MKRSLTNIILTVFFTVVALAIAIPTITLKINKQNYRIRGIDPQDINVNYVIKEFTLQPSTDLQGGNVVTLTADMSKIDASQRDSVFQRVKDILFTRLTLSQIGDFELSSQVNKESDKYRILIKLPQTFPKELVNLIVTVGQVNLWSEDPNSTIKPADMKTAFDGRKVTDITNSDFASVGVIQGDSRIFVSDPTKPNNFGLVVYFKQDSVSKFFSALYSAPRQTLAMMITIDNTPIAIQTSGQIFNQLNPGNELLLFTLVPDDSLDNSALAAVMSTPALPVNVTVASVDALPPTLGVNFLNNLKIAFLAAFAAVNGLLIILFKKDARFMLILNGIFLIWSIALLKIWNAVLSLPMFWGYILSLIGFLTFLQFLYTKARRISKSEMTNEEVKDFYSSINVQFRNIAIFGVMGCFVAYYFGTLLLRNMAIGLGFGLATGFLVMLLPVRAVLPYWFLKKNK